MDKAERRSRTDRVVTRRKEMRWSGMFEWADNRYIGRCKTRSPFDCGRPRCGLCGLKRKRSGKTRQEKRADLTLKENDENNTEESA
ncbi:MAG: hypothetical protein ACXAC5_02990 [Promethearchaeota archaeon]|jgi:hypothetical protein